MSWYKYSLELSQQQESNSAADAEAGRILDIMEEMRYYVKDIARHYFGKGLNFEQVIENTQRDFSEELQYNFRLSEVGELLVYEQVKFIIEDAFSGKK